ncbi:MAG: cupin domain-containing protein [Dermatophilaceae bacterium]
MRATLAGSVVTGLLDTRKVLDLHESGTTVVLQGLHRYWPPITALVGELEQELGHPCQANAYLTPPGAQGFAEHADTHDVFVVQTAGRKQWELHTDAGAEALLLEPGMCLYLPTGTRHSARTQQTLSLHVTIGVTQLTLAGLVRRAVADALAAVPATHLPAGFLHQPDAVAATLADALSALAGRIASIDASKAVETEIRRALSTRPPRLGGGLLDRAALADLSDDTVLERREGHPCVLRPDGDRIAILLGDRVLDVPGWLGPALEHVCRVRCLTPADLAAELDPQSRIVLCRRLVREGLLRVRR